MRISQFLGMALALTLALSCKKGAEADKPVVTEEKGFEYVVDQFADLRILRYQVPGFDELSLNEKKLVYYLTQAGLAGRDIIWDQNYRHNLQIREALENVYTTFEGDKSTADWKEFEVYLKRVWFSNGIHHHYSNDKLKPGFAADYLTYLLKETNTELQGEAFDVIFSDSDVKKVNKKKGVDNVAASAVNFYDPDITDAEVEAFYAAVDKGSDEEPIEAGLNTKLVRENGELVEKVYKAGGMYGEAISEIVKWLEKAVEVAENEKQANTLKLLISYYQTGSLDTWDEYAISWVNSTEGNIDWIQGFVEVYNDPKGYKGSYESIIQIKDFEMSRQMAVLSDNAQWFEDNSPLIEEHKKDNVVGVSYKTVVVAGEAGDASPSTPIGVNLPNNNWIRVKHGSKSVSLGNIIDAYNNAGGSGRLREFANDEEEVALELAYGELGDKLHTALHEVVGHASGQINPGVGQPKETLKNYSSTLEEGRADLVALYYLMDPKIQELGLVDDYEKLGKATYDGYIRNGLVTQLIRIELGDDIEEDHMVNRQWVSAWVFEKGQADNVIEKVSRNGKTYYNINDYGKLRELFGQLLRETQRIKSEGDFQAAQDLVEGYGVKVNQELHAEVLERNAQFTSAPYSGFVNPVLNPVMNDAGEITDVILVQPESFEEQMLDYSERYSTLSSK
ncbi:dipeptidyl-peptidase 3 family protein [Lentiprolixibacter aurantiacus]|uniref:Dihydrofolate reductase n=1 Tax=Lentiprolixibacter aurantiacus TaxID=2993939 RepID=A0AAE3SNX9_9FLAO|nr:dihydrofolate reductase [Lentiprolixibacter aurantiacus]MCX2720252.1 dihydrofolate reductase [Lentiprolixibacter aurantiacus]